MQGGLCQITPGATR